MEHLIPEESYIQVFLNGEKLVGLMCTPENLKELSIGYLFNTGLIKDLDEIDIITACKDMKIINVKTKNELLPSKTPKEMISTGCASSDIFNGLRSIIKPLASDYRISIERIREAFKIMCLEGIKYNLHGAIHASAMFDESSVITMEDIARHNASDKAVGAALMEGKAIDRMGIITSGRVSTDMALKAIVAGIPIIATRSKPTSLSVEIAKEFGLSIVGMALSEAPIVYSFAERILF